MRPRNGPFQILEAPEGLLGRALFHEHQTSFKTMFGGFESSKTVRLAKRVFQDLEFLRSDFDKHGLACGYWRKSAGTRTRVHFEPQNQKMFAQSVLGPARERISRFWGS